MDLNEISPKQTKQDAKAQIEQGDQFRNSGDIESATKSYRKATELEPDNELAWRRLGEVLEKYPGAPIKSINIEEPPLDPSLIPQNPGDSRRSGRTNIIEPPLDPRLIPSTSANTSKQKTNSLSSLKTVLIIFMLGFIVLGSTFLSFIFFFDQSMLGLYWPGEVTVAKNFSVSEGGRIDLVSASFYIPPEALLEDSTFLLKTLSSTPKSNLDSSLKPVGLPIQVQTTSSVLRSEATIAMRYDRKWLPRDINEENLEIARWDVDHWVFIESEIDTNNQIVLGKIQHFSAPILQLFGKVISGSSDMVSESNKANALLAQKDYKAAGEAYKALVDKYKPEDLKKFSDSDASLYWNAYYNLGLSLYKQGLYDDAGNVFFGLMQSADTESPDLIKEDGSGPALALTALQNWYPLGINTPKILEGEKILDQAPQELFNTDAEPYVYRSTLTLPSEELPAEIQDFIKINESNNNGEGTSQTAYLAELIVLSSYSQTSELLFDKNASAQVLEAVNDAQIKSAGIGKGAIELGQQVKLFITPFMNGAISTNNYQMNYPVMEDPRLRAPLVVLKIQKQWQTDRNYYGQYLFGLVPSSTTSGQNLPSTRYQEIRLQYQDGKLISDRQSYNWNVISQFITDDIQIKEEAGLDTQTAGVAAGGSHSCALSGGSVECWGSNKYGQLGTTLQDTEMSLSPVQADGLTSGVISVVTGNDHSCALTREGKVKCWGYNGSGQIGDGTTTNQFKPVDVIQLPEKIVAIVAGSNHTCGLTEKSSVWCWGSNISGQLGNINYPELSSQPVQVNNLSSIIAITAGSNHTCALDKNGEMFCWGANDEGQLGNQNNTKQDEPVKVPNLEKIQQIGAGSQHTCAISENGVFCWGFNGAGQLGSGDLLAKSSPNPVKGLDKKVVKLSTGYTHTCVLTEDNQVYCWGTNFNNQLNQGSSGKENSPVPVLITGFGGDVNELAAGRLHTCVLLKNGDIQCWGGNENGQLGGDLALAKAGLTYVIGFGGKVADAPDGKLVVIPVKQNTIELGESVTLKATDMAAKGDQNLLKEVIFYAAYDKGEWEKISSVTEPKAEESATWDSAGKKLNAPVSFKIEVIDQSDKKTTISQDYTFVDTTKPINADLVISPASGPLEMGQVISITATNVKDNLNGSGVQMVSFKISVIDPNGAVISEDSPVFLVGAPFVTQWKVPPDLKAVSGSSLRFTVTVTDLAENKAEFSSSLFALTDSIKPTDGKLDISQSATCGDANCIEYGATVTATVTGLKDNLDGSEIDSKTVELHILANGVEIEKVAMPGSAENYSATWPAKPSVELYYLPKPKFSFKVTAKDNAGNDFETTSADYSLLDSQEPKGGKLNFTGVDSCSTTCSIELGSEVTISVTGISDADGVGLDNASFNLEVTGSSLASTDSIKMTGSGGTYSGTWTAAASSFTDATPLQFKVTGKDIAGNEMAALQNNSYTLDDTIEPTGGALSITPLNNCKSAEGTNCIELGSTITASLSGVQDNQGGSGLNNSSFKLKITLGDATTLPLEQMAGSAGQYTTTWKAAHGTFTQGMSAEFEVIGEDNAGNIYNSDPINTKVEDTIAPTSGTLEITPQINCTDTTINCIELGSSVTAKVSGLTDNEAGSGIDTTTLKLFVNNIEVGTMTPDLENKIFTRAWNSEEFASFTQGMSLPFKVTGKDLAGNQFTLETSRTLKDTQAPTGGNVSIISPQECKNLKDIGNCIEYGKDFTATVTVTGITDNQGSGIKEDSINLELTANGSPVNLSSVPQIDGSSGSYTITVPATDINGAIPRDAALKFSVKGSDKAGIGFSFDSENYMVKDYTKPTMTELLINFVPNCGSNCIEYGGSVTAQISNLKDTPYGSGLETGSLKLQILPASGTPIAVVDLEGGPDNYTASWPVSINSALFTQEMPLSFKVIGKDIANNDLDETNSSKGGYLLKDSGKPTGGVVSMSESCGTNCIQLGTQNIPILITGLTDGSGIGLNNNEVSFEVSSDGAVYASGKMGGEGGIYSASWNATTIPNFTGTQNLLVSVKVKDIANNEETFTNSSYSLMDTIPPVSGELTASSIPYCNGANCVEFGSTIQVEATGLIDEGGSGINPATVKLNISVNDLPVWVDADMQGSGGTYSATVNPVALGIPMNAKIYFSVSGADFTGQSFPTLSISKDYLDTIKPTGGILTDSSDNVCGSYCIEYGTTFSLNVRMTGLTDNGGSGIDNSSVSLEIYVNRVLFNTVKPMTENGGSYSTSWISTGSLDLNSEITYQVTGSDLAGNPFRRYSSNTYLVRDTTAPTADPLVISSTLTCGASCIELGTTVTITAPNVSDNSGGSGISTVSLHILGNGVEIGSLLMTGVGNNYSSAWIAAPSYFTQGMPLSFRVIATDLVGISTTLYSTSYTLRDSIDPTGGVVSAVSNNSCGVGCFEYGSIATITLSGLQDNSGGSGINATSVTVAISSSGVPVGTLSMVKSGGNFTANWNASPLSFVQDMPLTFTVSGTDLAGNAFSAFTSGYSLHDSTP